MFDAMEAADGPLNRKKGDELDEYFADPPELAVSDPVKYWSTRTTSVPGLVRMGLDYSTIPGTSLSLSTSRLHH